MSLRGTNARIYTLFVAILKFIVNRCRTNNQIFTVSEIVDEAAAAIGNVSTPDRRALRNILSRRLERLVEVGCLKCKRNPTPKPSDYELTADALSVITDANTTDEVVGLMRHFGLVDTPVPEVTKQPRQKLLFSGKSSGISKDATAMRARAGIKIVLPDGTTAEFQNVDDAISFTRNAANEQQTADPQCLELRPTISALLIGQAEGLKQALNTLFATGGDGSVSLSLRYLSIALAQWHSIISGMKYDIGYAATTAADNGEPAVLTNEDNARLCAYLDDVIAAARKIETTGNIVLPSLSSAKDAKIPAIFRARENEIKWQYRGKTLPAQLQKDKG